MDEAFEKVDAELAAGNVVCIFPEGAITRDGEIHRFRPGIEKIIQRRPVPVVPAVLAAAFAQFSDATATRAQSLPEGAGRDTVEAICSSCHSTRLISRSSGYSRAAWDALPGP